jgi:hypothetical protein
MQYRKDKYGVPLSALGFGCMRFSRSGSSIDIPKAEKMIMAAYEAGVNYYDTAYIYPGSEVALGEILQKNGIREKVYIATKLPQYLVHRAQAIDKYFDEQLKRLRTDYIDYYLMHMLTDFAQWENLKKLGILEWIAAKKESGAIRNIGFSFHGNTEQFQKIVADYDWDFCQIQYNYMDEHTQAGVAGLKAAAAKGMHVVIMEPLRGGKLVNTLPPGAKKVIEGSPRGWSPAEWGLRWLWNQPEVTVVLSGMNSDEMVAENIRTASQATVGSFTEEDFALIEEIRREIRKTEKVNCTGCRYCMPCPQGVDIPGAFSCYNAMYAESKHSGRWQYFQTVSMREKPAFASQCIECGKCEKRCPQGIHIREKLKEADSALRPLPYRLASTVIRKYMFRRKK